MRMRGFVPTFMSHGPTDSLGDSDFWKGAKGWCCGGEAKTTACPSSLEWVCIMIVSRVMMQ